MKKWRRRSRDGPILAGCSFGPESVVLIFEEGQFRADWVWGGADPVEWHVALQRLVLGEWVDEESTEIDGAERFHFFGAALEPGSWRAFVRGVGDGSTCGLVSNVFVEP